MMKFTQSLARGGVLGLVVFGGLNSWCVADPANAQVGDAGHGKILFQQSCAICHAVALAPDNSVVIKQGPSLVGVIGRKAGTGEKFNYTPAMMTSGLTWDAPTVDRFLTNPMAMIPGTTMPIAVAKPEDRADLIAYLATLTGKGDVSAAGGSAPSPAPTAATSGGSDGDWQNAAPGVTHHINVADLPEPYATRSAGNGPAIVKQPQGAGLSVPQGFTVKAFATGFSNCRLVRVAPNGDIFVAETGASRIRILRAADGADAPSINQVFASGLDHQFGIGFYPPGNDPKWIYFANNNSVVRFPYKNGDLTVEGSPQTIVPQLTESHGGHSTRDLMFSLDGKRMFISVGSGSNVAEGIGTKNPDEVRAWEADHGFGATWGSETNRANILVTDPEGRAPLHTYATGIRNGVGIAVDPSTGKLWVSTNERDGLGDDLVPDYITSVKEGGYYGWPWYYMGNHEDPRLKGQRPDLAGKAIVPDVPVQAHSASLQLSFYTGSKGAAAFPPDYDGDIFAAFHGSWNRTIRTGYKIVRVHVKNGVATGDYEDFLTGFVVDNRSVWGRPVGVGVAHDGALLVTDDGSNTLWRIAYVGH
jgi:glucose/arabinose dehydrogenase